MIWFTSDFHVGHRNIIKYCNRPFQSVEEMDEYLLHEWHSKVSDDDTVYFLGDFSLDRRAERVLSMLNALPGDIHFIRGNHDVALKNVDLPQFHSGTLEVEIDGQRLLLSHYPFEEWSGMPFRNGRIHSGSTVWHLHGHSHGNLKTIVSGRYDISWDVHKCILSWDTIKTKITATLPSTA